MIPLTKMFIARNWNKGSEGDFDNASRLSFFQIEKLIWVLHWNIIDPARMQNEQNTRIHAITFIHFVLFCAACCLSLAVSLLIRTHACIAMALPPQGHWG